MTRRLPRLSAKFLHGVWLWSVSDRKEAESRQGGLPHHSLDETGQKRSRQDARRSIPLGSAYRFRHIGKAGVPRTNGELQDPSAVVQKQAQNREPAGAMGRIREHPRGHHRLGHLCKSSGAAPEQTPPDEDGKEQYVLRDCPLRRLRGKALLLHQQKF